MINKIFFALLSGFRAQNAHVTREVAKEFEAEGHRLAAETFALADKFDLEALWLRRRSF